MKLRLKRWLIWLWGYILEFGFPLQKHHFIISVLNVINIWRWAYFSYRELLLHIVWLGLVLMSWLPLLSWKVIDFILKFPHLSFAITRLVVSHLWKLITFYTWHKILLAYRGILLLSGCTFLLESDIILAPWLWYHMVIVILLSILQLRYVSVAIWLLYERLRLLDSLSLFNYLLLYFLLFYPKWFCGLSRFGSLFRRFRRQNLMRNWNERLVSFLLRFRLQSLSTMSPNIFLRKVLIEFSSLLSHWKFHSTLFFVPFR